MQIQPYLFFEGKTEEALEFYKDVVRTQGLNVEVTALLDNALNHPQFRSGAQRRQPLLRARRHRQGSRNRRHPFRACSLGRARRNRLGVLHVQP